MKDLRISLKQIVLISLGVTLFNSVIDPVSFLGIFSFFMTFVFFCAWINYSVNHLNSKKATKKEKLFSEIYFTIMFVISLLLLSTVLFKYSLGVIASIILLIVISPFKGMRFLLRPYGAWILLTSIVILLFIVMIRKMTKDE